MLLFGIFRTLDFLVLGDKRLGNFNILSFVFQYSIFIPKYPGIFSLRLHFFTVFRAQYYGSENGRISQQFTPKNAHKRSNEESSTGASCWPIFYGHKRIVSRVFTSEYFQSNNFVSKVKYRYSKYFCTFAIQKI